MNITPFTIEIPQAELDDLKQRLSHTRWPRSFESDDWSRGVPKKYLQRIAEYWEKQFDWRAQEASINQYPQFIAEIDGQPVHFIHIKAAQPDALPLLLNHGYPGSIVEVLPLIDRLTKPAEHGDSPEQAFHVVVPSLPGFGFSNPVTQAGWDIGRTSRAYAGLMSALGYERYGVQGSDIGAGICQQMALLDPAHIVGVHTSSDPTALALTGMLNMIPVDRLPETEKAQIARWKAYAEAGKGYLVVQSTRPETTGFALTDSPVGQLAWILEKFQEWTNPAAILPEDAVSLDRLLANVSLYWFTRSGASAAQFLYEAAHAQPAWGAVPTVPAGSAIFNAESFIRMILDPEHKALHWSEFKEGGHFPALEVPDLLAGDLRRFFFESLQRPA
jgi:pimeloyl-ACP methyl ester carboxylesterase